MAVPVSASQLVRCGPMRWVTLQVPPDPGTRPIATSGSRKVVPGAATTR